MSFYARLLLHALTSGRISNRDTVLVVCGGAWDRDNFIAAGFDHVTISNLDCEMGKDVLPYRWEMIDAERIPRCEGSVDIVAVHAGLHHCFSPHRAMLEMYRVARKAVIVIEARDSLTMRLAVALGLTDDYETETTNRGGAGFTPAPNFVYRWTEREVRKAVASFDPRHRPDLKFLYGLRLPHERVVGTGWREYAVELARPFAVAMQRVFPRQGNEFGWIIWKDRLELNPWIREKADVAGPCARRAEAA